MKTIRSCDLIGDIHGHAGALENLLRQLGYQPAGAGWRHPEGRMAIFLGDYIDRGPGIRRALEIVRVMVDSGQAHALMGNHEFNALAYHTPDGGGGWLRKRTSEKVEPHSATVKQIVEPFPEEWSEWMEWFRRLPLFLELPGLRAAHAAWNEESVHSCAAWDGSMTGCCANWFRQRTPSGALGTVCSTGSNSAYPTGISFRTRAVFDATPSVCAGGRAYGA